MTLMTCAAITVVACSRSNGTGNAPPPAEAGGPDAATAHAVTVPRAFADGPHDYRGTIATTTNVSVHLVRSGSKVTGAYAYAKLGTPIGLEGSVAADGSLALDEFVMGSVTGHLDLHGEGADLIGTWSDLSRKKTWPLRLAPGAPLSALLVDAGAAPSANRRAEQCLDDLMCSADEVERLFLAAEDAHDPTFDCARFLDGVGLKKDLVRGRSCLERTASGSSCSEASIDLASAELALMRMDGVGGRRETEAVRKMLASCFQDSTVTGLLEHAAPADSTTPADVCKDLGQTTLVGNECTFRRSAREHDRASLLAKKVAEGLSEKGRALLRAATKAFVTYVEAESAYIYTLFAGGSLRNIFGLNHAAELHTARAKDLAAFTSFVAAATSDDAQREEKALAAATSTVTRVDKIDATKDSDVAQQAWRRYRDAEIALYANVFGKAQGEARVRDSVTAMLTSRRTKEVTTEF